MEPIYHILKVAMHLHCDVLSVLILQIIEKEKCRLGTWFYALLVDDNFIYKTFIYLCFRSRYPTFYGAFRCQNCRTSCPFGTKKCSHCGIHIAISEDKVCMSGKMMFESSCRLLKLH